MPKKTALGKIPGNLANKVTALGTPRANIPMIGCGRFQGPAQNNETLQLPLLRWDHWPILAENLKKLWFEYRLGWLKYRHQFVSSGSGDQNASAVEWKKIHCVKTAASITDKTRKRTLLLIALAKPPTIFLIHCQLIHLHPQSAASNMGYTNSTRPSSSSQEKIYQPFTPSWYNCRIHVSLPTQFGKFRFSLCKHVLLKLRRWGEDQA